MTDRPPRGIPGARNFDHAGVAVRNLDEAVAFFVDVLGAELLFQSDPVAGLETKEHAPSGTTVRVAFLRLGPNANLELLQFDGPDARGRLPRVSQHGAMHVGLRVDDVDVAAAYLRQQPGVEIVGDGPGPPAPDGPDQGARWVYARTPFGVYVELVSRPDHMPYERATAARFYGPAKAWDERIAP